MNLSELVDHFFHFKYFVGLGVFLSYGTSFFDQLSCDSLIINLRCFSW